MPEESQEAAGIEPDADWARYLDSYEGLVLTAEVEPVSSRWRGMRWDEAANAVLAWVGEIIPGVTLAALLAFAAQSLSEALGVTLLGFERSPISAIMLSVAIGLVVRNTVGIPDVYDEGLKFCIRTVLRAGIALLGIRLSLFAAGAIGLSALPIVAVCIVLALAVVGWAGRWLGLPPRLGSLIAVGTSICGVSAIVATAPVIDADEDEVSYAVACITLFGMVALFAYPFLAYTFFDGDATAIGIFLGTAIHDTAQVAGAGLMVQEQFQATEAMEAAVVVKLLRNLFLVGVIPWMAFVHRSDGDASGPKPGWQQLVPLFVLGFAAMVALRTIGDFGSADGLAFGFLEPAAWNEWVARCATLASWFLMLAMAAVGLGTQLSSIRILGWRPLALGLAAALLVGAASATLLSLGAFV